MEEGTMFHDSKARPSSYHCRHKRTIRSLENNVDSNTRLQPQPVNHICYKSLRIYSVMNRFDIDDRKGLEIVVLTALMTFHDYNEAHHNPEPASVSSSNIPNSNPLSRVASALKGSAVASNDTAPPPPPPRPAPRTGVDRIAEIQTIKGEYNEITVSGEGTIEEYGEYCHTLLQVGVFSCLPYAGYERAIQDEAMLFITIKSAEAEHVPKVLQVVEETKRIRHKAGMPSFTTEIILTQLYHGPSGLSDDEELHQYVLYDTQESKKGPRRINLDDDPKDKYSPPKNLTIHLSKIPLPELQPKGQTKEKPGKDSNKKKEDKKSWW